jgi:hypothetical protein
LVDAADTLLDRGQQSFETGNYREAVDAFVAGVAVAKKGTPIHGEISTWLVLAYQAMGDLDQAIELCRRVQRHPHLETRQRAKGILYILEAPELKMDPDWLSEIPDLTDLEPRDRRNWGSSASFQPRSLKPEIKTYIPEPADPSKVEIEDDRLIWGGLLVAGLVVVVVGLVSLR